MHNNRSEPGILMFVPQYPYPVVGGLERQSHELSKALIKKGAKVLVLSGKINGHGKNFEIVENVNVYRLPWPDNKIIRLILEPFFLIFRLIGLQNHYDIVHIHNISWVGGLVLAISKLLGKKTLVKLPNVRDFGIPGIRKKYFGSVLLNIFKQSDVLIAMSDDSAEEILEIDYPKNKILKITNGVSTSNFCHDPKDLPITGSPINVVFAGRLVAQKGIADLLGIWKKATDVISGEAHLNICGDGPLKDELIQVVEADGIQKSVTFLGHIDNMAAILKKADIFVLPSYFEGNSNAILEAMASGLPIISTCVGGTTRLVGEKGIPLIFNPGDKVALEQILSQLLASTAMQKEYGTAMRERILNEFSIDAVAKRYYSVYLQMIDPVIEKSVNDFSAPIFNEKI